MEEQPPPPSYVINGQIITILISMNLGQISPPVDFTTYSFVINTGATLDISGTDLKLIDLSGVGNIGLGNGNTIISDLSITGSAKIIDAHLTIGKLTGSGPSDYIISNGNLDVPSGATISGTLTANGGTVTVL